MTEQEQRLDRNEEKHYDIAQIGLWYGCNYGAILTTYALYRHLTGLGKRVLLLNQAPLAGNPMYLDTTNISYRFMERHGVERSAPLKSDDDLMALNNRVETFVVGSDQVWRWAYSANQGLFYFLDFVRGDKRKIAYSASFGLDREERPAASLAKARYYLQAFDAVSVREQSGLDILEHHYNVHGAWQPDPVFLHEAGFYRELAGCEVKEAEPYLFAYILDMTPATLSLVQTVAATRNLRVHIFEDGNRKTQECGGSELPSPEEWLQEIAHCSYFVTDSFHGVCFAHIFNKEFLCTAPALRGQTRFESLLAYTGLQQRLVTGLPAEDALAVSRQPIDWPMVNTKLATAREQGRTWLENALNAPRPAWRVILGDLAHEMLYAGFGEKERTPRREAEVRMYEQDFLTHKLPRLLRLKRFWHRAWMYVTAGIARARHAARLQELRALARYLERRNSRPFR